MGPKGVVRDEELAKDWVKGSLSRRHGAEKAREPDDVVSQGPSDHWLSPRCNQKDGRDGWRGRQEKDPLRPCVWLRDWDFIWRAIEGS